MIDSKLMVWVNRLTVGILIFISTWMFTTILEVKGEIIKLQQKYDDDKAQWVIIQQVYERQNDQEVQLKFHTILLEDLRRNRSPNEEHTKDVGDLIDKLDEINKKKSVDEFRDYHQEQRQMK